MNHRVRKKRYHDETRLTDHNETDYKLGNSETGDQPERDRRIAQMITGSGQDVRKVSRQYSIA